MTHVITDRPTSEQDIFRIAAKKRLIELGLSIKELAQRTGYSRTAVSMAINRGLNRGVLDEVSRELGIKL